AIGERAVGPDRILLGPGRVDAVERERDRLHQRALPATVLAEDPDHPGGELQVDLLEHAVVPQGELEDPHTTSPLASSKKRSPSDSTRSRSTPARSCCST